MLEGAVLAEAGAGWDVEWYLELSGRWWRTMVLRPF